MILCAGCEEPTMIKTPFIIALQRPTTCPDDYRSVVTIRYALRRSSGAEMHKRVQLDDVHPTNQIISLRHLLPKNEY